MRQTVIIPNKPVPTAEAYKAINAIWQVAKHYGTDTKDIEWDLLIHDLDKVCMENMDNSFLWHLAYGLIDYYEATQEARNEK